MAVCIKYSYRIEISYDNEPNTTIIADDILNEAEAVEMFMNAYDFELAMTKYYKLHTELSGSDYYHTAAKIFLNIEKIEKAKSGKEVTTIAEHSYKKIEA